MSDHLLGFILTLELVIVTVEAGLYHVYYRREPAALFASLVFALLAALIFVLTGGIHDRNWAGRVLYASVYGLMVAFLPLILFLGYLINKGRKNAQ